MHLQELWLTYWRISIFIFFATLAGIQVFYYLFFFYRLAFYKLKKRSNYRSNAVSVVICARDEAANLAKNLPGALVQDYKTTHEVIVVNDNSVDESKYLLEELQKEFKQLHVIELKQEAKMIQGKKFPLSMGIKSAKYEIILLTDADCVPATEHWIETMQAAYNDDTEIVLGYGAFHKRPGFFNKLVRWETFHTALQYFSYALAHIPYMGVGRNLSYRKGLFFKNKGFSSHNQVPGGDDDLFINKTANSTNTQINIQPESFTLSSAPKTWQQWNAQKHRHYTTSKYYKPKHKFLLGLYSFSHFLFYPLLAVSIVFFDWKWSLMVFGIRFLIQLICFYFTTKKLNEKDLFPFFLIFDIWMFFYYLIFAPALIKKPASTWK